MTHQVGVVLSGCGYLDGSAIHEAVSTLLALDEAGVQTVCMAPNIPFEVVDHLTGKETGEQRNVLTESARIARGDIRDLKDVSADQLDALILPGGFGAAKNLSSFATDGVEMTVLPEVEKLVLDVHQAGKPIGAICIAPAIISKLIPGVSLTIGNDRDTAAALEQMGSRHQDCPVSDYVVDREKKVVSTPAYMLGPWVAAVNQGIARCVREVLGMLD